MLIVWQYLWWTLEIVVSLVSNIVNNYLWVGKKGWTIMNIIWEKTLWILFIMTILSSVGMFVIENIRWDMNEKGDRSQYNIEERISNPAKLGFGLHENKLLWIPIADN